MDLGRFKLIEISNQFSNNIWNEVQKWNRFDQDTIGKQLVRAADSISANLSEAYGRFTYADRRRFSLYSRGSLCETLNWIDKSIKRGLIDDEIGQKILEDLQKLSVAINRYINSLNNSISKSP